MKTIAVFFGGHSNEREISVITGMLAVNLLKSGGYRVLPVYLDEEDHMLYCPAADGVPYFAAGLRGKEIPICLFGGELVPLKRGKKIHVDCALNCCHGGAGEDGTLAALLRFAKIPSASPDVPISALFMNKEYSKLCAFGMGIPVLPYFAVSEAEWRENPARIYERAEELKYPLVVKPSELGSSIGITVADNGEGLSKAFQTAFELDRGAIVEKYVVARRDINCAVYRYKGDLRVSPLEEILSMSDILTFSEKYEGSDASVQTPADLPEEITKRIQEYTKLIYESFHCCGVVRADFLVDGEEVYFNELNTVPGSLAFRLFGKSLSSAKKTVCELVEEGMTSRETPKKIISSGILGSSVFVAK